MKHSLAFACACTMTTATAGGLDQSGQPVTLLFRDGNYAEVAVGYWNPTVEGSDVLGTGSGNVYGPITDVFAGVKKDLGDRLSAALILDQPYGVNVDYPDGDFLYAGTMAKPDSLGVTGLVRWRAGANFALHGGVRTERIGAEVTLGGAAYGPFDGYSWNADDDWGVGWVAGASWEKPEIGLRVALTYGSEIRHELELERELLRRFDHRHHHAAVGQPRLPDRDHRRRPCSTARCAGSTGTAGPWRRRASPRRGSGR